MSSSKNKVLGTKPSWKSSIPGGPRLVVICGILLIQTAKSPAAEEVIRNIQPGHMLVKQGDVKFRPAAQPEIAAAQPQPLGLGDSLHTLQLARATVRFVDWSTLRMKELTVLEVQGATQQVESAASLTVHQGQVYVSSRGPAPATIPIDTPHVHTLPRGTEFLVAVNPARTEVTMLDGEAQMQSASDPQPVRVRTGEQGIAIPGQPTQVRPILQAQNIVQWWLYYPGVLDPAEIGLTAQERTRLAASLTSYQHGDLLQALTNYPGYPAPPEPAGDAERIYLAGLFLSVGALDRSDALLKSTRPDAPSLRALRTMIRAVSTDFRYLFATNRPAAEGSSGLIPATASEWLAVSYAHQATNNLVAALQAARKATGISPGFGFAWARVGELEFSFGRTRPAREAALQAIHLSPRNAQAHALNGFLLAGEEDLSPAIAAFNRAIEIDPALGNAWLGRGLCKRRLGGPAWRPDASAQGTNWLADLQTAASLEPTRSLVRSYAGKGFGEVGDDRLAHKELNYATKLDPNDPTPWLYRALIEQQENRVNEAVRDLEASQDRNDNRSLFRSRLLLDEDRAVRSANLATIYRDAGLPDLGAREASRAVVADYANYSAHLFLANSYNQLRDPALINLRYETATFSEYLLANLLSPVGGSALSPYVSQQEYSRLFEQNRLGISSETTYSSRGDWQQQAAQFGCFGSSAYSVDVFYRSLNGNRPNNDLEQQAYSAQFKQQITPRDSIYLQAVLNKFESGDVHQVYDPTDTNQFSPTLRIREKQEPNLFLGYHHEWGPGMHTLFLGGRLQDRFRLSVSNLVIRGVERDGSGAITNTVQGICQALKDLGAYPPDFDVSICDLFDELRFESDFEAYSAELQQIAQVGGHTFIVGGRFQDGETETRTREVRLAGSHFPPYAGFGTNLVSVQQPTTDLTRLSVYAYDQWQVVSPLWLTAGVTYDRLHYPRNVDSAPVTVEEKTQEQVSPKAGFIWAPLSATTIRGAYTRSLGGLFYDTSVRLEPVQVAGFNQAYRSIIPESVAGAIPGSKFETADLGFEQKLHSGTYLVFGAELLKSEASRLVGVFNFPAGIPSQTAEKLEFEEHSLSASLSQLLGRNWALSIRYRVSEAELRNEFPEIAPGIMASTKNRSLLHNLELVALFNHPSGLFAEGQAIWIGQSNYGPAAPPGDEFWQFNLFGGYRFWRRQAQLSVGILNLTAQDYRLNPLNLYAELPRDRTLVTSLKFNF